MSYEKAMHLLASRVEYSKETGDFIWRCGRRRWDGMKAGGIGADGYRYIRISLDGRLFTVLAHRLAWLMATGSMPSGVIDHINRNRADNRISNLRCVTAAENNRNRSGNSRGLGMFGVTINRPNGRFRARANFDGVRHYLGHYSTPQEAALAVAEFHRRHGFSCGHGEKRKAE